MPAQRQGEWFLGEKRAKTGLGTVLGSRSVPGLVMAGLVPAIHVLLTVAKKDVDARLKAGHDGVNIAPKGFSYLATCRPQESRAAESAARR
jgi:hypothetical protein